MGGKVLQEAVTLCTVHSEKSLLLLQAPHSMAMAFNQETLIGEVPQEQRYVTFKLGYKIPSTPRPGTGRGGLLLSTSIEQDA